MGIMIRVRRAAACERDDVLCGHGRSRTVANRMKAIVPLHSFIVLTSDASEAYWSVITVMERIFGSYGHCEKFLRNRSSNSNLKHIVSANGGCALMGTRQQRPIANFAEHCNTKGL
jgi:hypothetical protein